MEDDDHSDVHDAGDDQFRDIRQARDKQNGAREHRGESDARQQLEIDTEILVRPHEQDAERDR